VGWGPGSEKRQKVSRMYYLKGPLSGRPMTHYSKYQLIVRSVSSSSYFDVVNRALHSELLTELSSRNEFSRVETGLVERHFFVIFGNFGKRQLPKLAKTKSSEKRNFSQFFHDFLQFFMIFSQFFVTFRDFPVGFLSRNEFSRAGTSSVKARKTRPDSKFRKTAISETREMKILEKKRLSQGLSRQSLPIKGCG